MKVRPKDYTTEEIEAAQAALEKQFAQPLRLGLSPALCAGLYYAQASTAPKCGVDTEGQPVERLRLR